jgi:putative tryptophan/tyrosine transport system substrate-binding protein
MTAGREERASNSKTSVGKHLTQTIRVLFNCLLLAFFLPTDVSVEAQQQGKIPRIGFLTGSSLSSQLSRNEAFRRGLRDLGYVEGKNVVIEWRSYEGQRDRQRALVAELVRSNVEVIVAVGSGDIRSAKEATSTIPIVMLVGGDPVASGFVASLARPGGNVTGLATLRPELSGKRLELLKEVVPRLARVAVFASPLSEDHSRMRTELELAAGSFGVTLQYFDVQNASDVEPAFRAAAKERADAIFFRVPGPQASSQRPHIVSLAQKTRIPAIYEGPDYVEAGGLMSYGISVTDSARRAAVYVDKILKGAKPADLPIEQPTKFELVINLKTAKQIGLTIPPNVLARADRVIK